MSGPSAPHRDPIDVLRDDPDPLRRSRAHTELGLRAKARQDVEGAVFHLREAVDLDPTDETPKDVLRSLGRSPDPHEITAETTDPRYTAPTSLFERLFRGLKRRVA